MKIVADKIIPHYIQKIKQTKNIKYKTHPSDENPGNVNILVKNIKQENICVALRAPLLL